VREKSPQDSGAVGRAQAARTDRRREPPGGADGSLGQFLAELLGFQCHCCQAQRGAVLRSDGEKGFAVLALYPRAPGEEDDQAWLQHCANAGQRALSADTPLVVPMQGNGRTHLVLVPLEMQAFGRMLQAFLVKTANNTTLDSTRQLLQLTTSLVSLTQKHLTQHGKDESLNRLQQAMETLAAINHQNRFKSVAMAFCNEMAAQWACERVSLGFLKGRYVRVKALSHTEHYSRKMRLIQDIEAVMEECLDQDCEVCYPADEEATFISRAAGEMCLHQGQKAVLSLPLRQQGKPQAVVTLERVAEEPFTPEEAETIRLTCDLCAPRLMNLHDHDRWLCARAASRVGRGLAVLVGAEHTWAKLAAVFILAGIVFLTFAKGRYKVKAPFSLEAVSQYKITAPFDGYIKDVTIEVGDPLLEGKTALAQLDTAELRLQLAAARAEQAGYLKQADAAMRDAKIAEAQIARANAERAQAQIDLLTYRIGKATIVSPVTGTLVSGDLKRQIGAPVETGKVLFEVSPLDSLRAELYVPEDEVFDIKVGQQGYLATASYPAQRLRFLVERINPAAEVVNNRNVFKVRAKLLESKPWMRPGM